MHVEIADDGRGIDIAAVRAAAVQRGALTAAQLRDLVDRFIGIGSYRRFALLDARLGIVFAISAPVALIAAITRNATR